MNKLKELREEHNYTQKTLAKELGMSKGTISSYEQGLRSITVPVAMKLGELFDVEWHIFFEDEVSDSYDKVK